MLENQNFSVGEIIAQENPAPQGCVVQKNDVNVFMIFEAGAISIDGLSVLAVLAVLGALVCRKAIIGRERKRKRK